MLTCRSSYRLPLEGHSFFFYWRFAIAFFFEVKGEKGLHAWWIVIAGRAGVFRKKRKRRTIRADGMNLTSAAVSVLMDGWWVIPSARWSVSRTHHELSGKCFAHDTYLMEMCHACYSDDIWLIASKRCQPSITGRLD
jgi:hypothetical protein